MIYFSFSAWILNVIEVISRLSFEIRPIEIWETFSVSGFFERKNLFILSIVEESRYESGRFYRFYDLKKIPPFLILLKPFQLKELNSKSWNSWMCTLMTTDIRGGRPSDTFFLSVRVKLNLQTEFDVMGDCITPVSLTYFWHVYAKVVWKSVCLYYLGGYFCISITSGAGFCILRLFWGASAGGRLVAFKHLSNCMFTCGIIFPSYLSNSFKLVPTVVASQSLGLGFYFSFPNLEFNNLTITANVNLIGRLDLRPFYRTTFWMHEIWPNLHFAVIRIIFVS